MKETFTYKEIQEASQASQQLVMMKVPQKTAYRLSRIIEKIRSAGKDINKEQLKLYEKYGHEKTPGRGDWTVPEANQADFMKNFDVMMENTIEVEFMPVACNMFEELPAACILGMGKFMIEEEKIVVPGR